MSHQKKRRKIKPEQVVIKEQVVTPGGGRRIVSQTPLVNVVMQQPGLAVDAMPHLDGPPAFPDHVNEHIPEEHSHEPCVSQHQKRKEEVTKKWASIMDDLQRAFVCQQGLPTYLCCPQCGTSVDDDATTCTCIIKCEDCNRFLCTECVEDLHEYQPLHTMKIWNKDGSCTTFSYKRVYKFTPHNCGGYLVEDDLTVIDERGKIFECRVQHCSCTTLPVHLINIGLWPSSPAKPTRAYHQGFLRLLVYLMLEGHLSLQAACQSFMWTNNWTSKLTESIYKQLCTEECFEEFRHFHYQMRTLEGLSVDDQCPACPSIGGTTFLSLDANFGLVRKNNAGRSVVGSKHDNRLFLKDEEVSAFVNHYNIESGKSDGDSDCNQFQAGDSVRSKNKALQLDKTGVFGSVCKHGFPVKFMNMEHGERYAYPVLMLKKLIEEKQGTTLTVSYDIACKLKAHFEKTKQTEILDSVKLVLPCWHAYGHNAACQVMFSTRMVENCGLTDGEEMERLWSYLRPFCHITKEMTPSHRVDLLSDALLHYGRKKANDIVDVIGQRTEKARLIHQRAMEQLQDLIKDNYSLQEVADWKEDERIRLKRAKSSTKLSWKEEYVNKLQSYQHFRDQLVATDDEEVFVVVNQHCERIDRELKTLEARHHIQRRWVEGEKDYNDALKHLELQQKGALIRKLRHDVAEYHFLQETMRKEGAGQAIATRIKKQLEKASQIINNTVTRYNKNNFRTEFLLPRQVLRKDALNTQHDMYYVQEERRSDVNQSLQHKAVRLLNLAQRAEEEKDFVKAEKDNVLQHYKQCCERLETAASSRTEQNVYVSGLRHLMVKKMQDYKDTVTKIQDAFFASP